VGEAGGGGGVGVEGLALVVQGGDAGGSTGSIR